jgi:hypothetical protein
MEAGRRDAGVAGSLSAPLRALAEALAEMQVPGMLIGGLAAILHGVPRATRDVDATILGSSLGLPEILAGFARFGLTPRISDALEFARQHQVLLLRHGPSGVDVDVTIAWLPFEIEAVDAALIRTVDEVSVRVVRPEDLIIYKVVAWRPQDRQDVERLLASHGRSVDLGRVRRVVAEFADALDRPELVAEFEEMIAQLGLGSRSR